MITNYDQFIEALRVRADKLGLTRETIDEVSGLQPGYSAKLLAPVPMKTLGKLSFGLMLQALGLAIVLVEDGDAMGRFAGQYSARKRVVRAPGTHEILSYRISRRKLKRMARLGGKKRAQILTPKQRSRSARKAAHALWRKRRRAARRKVARVRGTSPAVLPPSQEPRNRPPQSSGTGEPKGPSPRQSVARQVSGLAF